jgi:hypothetical protein
MRTLRMLTSAAVLTASLVAFPASATAQTTYEHGVWGTEVYATSTKGRFVGTANGSATGTWYAEVIHTPLGSGTDPDPADISDGSFGMVLTKAEPGRYVRGEFSDSGGSITQINPSAKCTNQEYVVDGNLHSVSADGRTGGTGHFRVMLTHHRASIFGTCRLYAATVHDGNVTLTF